MEMNSGPPHGKEPLKWSLPLFSPWVQLPVSRIPVPTLPLVSFGAWFSPVKSSGVSALPRSPFILHTLAESLCPQEHPGSQLRQTLVPPCLEMQAVSPVAPPTLCKAGKGDPHTH